MLLNFCHKRGIFHTKRKPNFLMTDLGLTGAYPELTFFKKWEGE